MRARVQKQLNQSWPKRNLVAPKLFGWCGWIGTLAHISHSLASDFDSSSGVRIGSVETLRKNVPKAGHVPNSGQRQL